MKYLAMLKKEENTYHEALPKLPEPPFDSFDSDPERHVSEKQAPPASIPDPGPDWYDDRICEAIDDLAAVEIMAVPEPTRRKAQKLFNEFSEAAAQGDDARFWAALRAWRETWLKSLH